MESRPPLTEALHRLATITPYFELRHGRAEATRGRPSALLRTPEVAAERFDEAAAALGTAERRVAVSWVFLDWAARLWSVALGTALLTGRSVALDPERLRFSRDDGFTVLHMAAPTPGGTPAGEVIDGHLAPLVSAWGHLAAPGLLWGNAASCLVTAGSLLGDDAEPLVAAALTDRRLAGALDARTHRRRSCCLFYRSATGGYCGDCALTARD
ncbi:(2Fe-2S)-binding protein [Gordonia caeni]|uniref:Ferric siderophore reductase C-terminal domain-containing protein n=1 Tax=Gordonia caeni TaxID=1007097 RepID=A0ABP7PS65_9ACTN